VALVELVPIVVVLGTVGSDLWLHADTRVRAE